MTEDSLQPLWFGKSCFFSIRRPISVDTIDGFSNLRYDDQKEIRKCLDDDQPLEPELEKQIVQQNADYFVAYDKLKTLEVEDNVAILKAHNQFIPKDSADVRRIQFHSLAKLDLIQVIFVSFPRVDFNSSCRYHNFWWTTTVSSL